MKRMTPLVPVVFPLALVLAAPAAAQPPSAADFRPGFYAGLSAGQGEAKDTCAGCDDNDTAWKIFGGYQFTRTLGVEVGYQDFGTFGSAAIGGVTPAGSADANAFEIVAVGTIPVHPRFGIYGKAGAYRYDVDNSATGLSHDGNELTFGAGVKYHFTRNVAGRLEWQRYMDMGAVNANSESDVDVLSLGVQVQW